MLAAYITTLVVLGHISALYEIPYIYQIEDILYDTRVRLTAPGGVDERIGAARERFGVVLTDDDAIDIEATRALRERAGKTISG